MARSVAPSAPPPLCGGQGVCDKAISVLSTILADSQGDCFARPVREAGARLAKTLAMTQTEHFPSALGPLMSRDTIHLHFLRRLSWLNNTQQRLQW
jgi:hypothetical protein